MRKSANTHLFEKEALKARRKFLRENPDDSRNNTKAILLYSSPVNYTTNSKTTQIALALRACTTWLAFKNLLALIFPPSRTRNQGISYTIKRIHCCTR